MQPHALRFGRRQWARLVPYGVGDPEPSQVVHQAGTAQDGHFLVGEPRHAAGFRGQVGDTARVTGDERGFQVDQVCHGLENVVQLGAGDMLREVGLGIDDGVPGRGDVELVEHSGSAVLEQVGDRRVEQPSAVAADHGTRGLDASRAAVDLGDAGQLHQPDRHGDGLAA